MGSSHGGPRLARRSLLAGAAALAACGPSNAVLILGRRLTPELVDRDPFALLPGGPIVLATVDAASLFRTGIGAEVDALVASVLPIGPEANFVAQRDVTRVLSGVYAMQGADFCSVLQGNFDEAAIRQAANGRAATPSGAPLVRTVYAGQEMFTVSNLGFVLVTPHTLLAGNEVGMRRALDRVRFAPGPRDRLERAVPEWMVRAAEPVWAAPKPGAAPVHFSVALDLADTPGGFASGSLPIATGLRRGRMLGNLASPGVNVAGTLSYQDEASARAGAADVQNVHSLTKLVSLFTSWGLSSAPPAQAEVRGSEVGFAMAIDDATARTLVRVLGAAARRAVQPA